MHAGSESACLLKRRTENPCALLGIAYTPSLLNSHAQLHRTRIEPLDRTCFMVQLRWMRYQRPRGDRARRKHSQGEYSVLHFSQLILIA